MIGDHLRSLAFHLPQYHPIPENDEWWGKGFTEWTNVTKAKPLFKGHHQPHLPADLGFYDLRLPEARLAQAELARQYGIHGFCYYHYWFNGRRLLERPVTEMLASGEPDFPFCLCWANESWSRRWDGMEREILLEQKYSPEDDLTHLRALLPVFADKRYITVEGKPLFLIYRSKHLPDARATTDRWRQEAQNAGLPGLYLVRVDSFTDEVGDPRFFGFDAALEFQPNWKNLDGLRIRRRKWWHRRKLRTWEPAFAEHRVYDYNNLLDRAISAKTPEYPMMRCVCPGWDNTARRKTDGIIFINSTPEAYERWLAFICRQVRDTKGQNGAAPPLIFINAWNEWAEGNHLEPCQQWGRAYLEATRRALTKGLILG